jgi:hypothetical protein
MNLPTVDTAVISARLEKLETENRVKVSKRSSEGSRLSEANQFFVAHLAQPDSRFLQIESVVAGEAVHGVDPLDV